MSNKKINNTPLVKGQLFRLSTYNVNWESALEGWLASPRLQIIAELFGLNSTSHRHLSPILFFTANVENLTLRTSLCFHHDGNYESPTGTALCL